MKKPAGAGCGNPPASSVVSAAKIAEIVDEMIQGPLREEFMQFAAAPVWVGQFLATFGTPEVEGDEVIAACWPEIHAELRRRMFS